ncbi:hypothetical protein DPEC_G00202380 [Dallia pectoralis]|uniref:Uncharacterized protein n=1 Tax=Dallia pectoralis TaxID=75939 RepID=A0ACC2G9J5_DALPE|nr:hypothetical protein DPEC_G00202380 [Dallia pectoralis]
MDFEEKGQQGLERTRVMDTFDLKTWLDKETVEILFSEKANFMEKHLHDTEDGFMKDLDGSLCSTVTTLIEDESMSKSDQWRSAERLEERVSEMETETERWVEIEIRREENLKVRQKLRAERKRMENEQRVGNEILKEWERELEAERRRVDEDQGMRNESLKERPRVEAVMEAEMEAERRKSETMSETFFDKLRKGLNPPKAKQVENRRDDSSFDGMSDSIFGRLKKSIKSMKKTKPAKRKVYSVFDVIEARVKSNGLAGISGQTGKDTSEDIRQSESIFGQLKNKIKQRKLKQEEKSRKYHFQLVNTPVPKLESRTTSKRPPPDSKKQPKPAKCKDYSIFAAAPTAL